MTMKTMMQGRRRALALSLTLAATLVAATETSGEGGWLLVRPPEDCALIAGLAAIQVYPGALVPGSCARSAGDVNRALELMARVDARPVYRTVIASFFDEAASITRWVQVWAFDTAQACEAARFPVIATDAAMEQLLDRDLAIIPTETDFEQAYTYVAGRLSRCVPTSAVFAPAR
jgi:hypothetical protein